MPLDFNLLFVILFTLFVHYKCVFTLKVSSDHVEGKELAKEEIFKASTVDASLVDAPKVIKKSGQVIDIPLVKSTDGNPENQGKLLNKGVSQYMMEGGAVDLTTALPINDRLGTGEFEEAANHSKGSKGRKGVQYPGSSIVPRKGVDTLEVTNLNQTSVSATLDPVKESTNLISNNKMLLNKTEPQQVKPEQQKSIEKSTPKVPHPKKPEVVSDVEDVDDFEKYSIIKTSTTGEDYIIIGIVIVLCIWCSIFGALIFYRRAGEYWDRRHYRRMDFLVEGMYND